MIDRQTDRQTKTGPTIKKKEGKQKTHLEVFFGHFEVGVDFVGDAKTRNFWSILTQLFVPECKINALEDIVIFTKKRDKHLFLLACTRLNNPLCLSVGPSVGLLVSRH